MLMSIIKLTKKHHLDILYIMFLRINREEYYLGLFFWVTYSILYIYIYSSLTILLNHKYSSVMIEEVFP